MSEHSKDAPEGRDPVDVAVEVLRAGGLVAIPTETVYGLAADASNPDAVAKIFAAKGRPADHPLIVHIQGPGALDTWAADLSPAARALAEAFWPGPLTLICARSLRVGRFVTGGLETVGLRAPSHPLAQRLLRAFGGGLAAPSANRFGHVSPTTAAHVRADLGDRVDLVLDGGPCEVGIESTIVDVSGETPRILRPGAIPQARVQAALAPLGLSLGGDLADAPRSPGQLPAHYQPRARVDSAERSELAAHVGADVVVIAGAPLEVEGALAVLALGASPEAFGRGLYAALREADALGARAIVVERPAERGLGVAILDRIRRASAPRE